jgi:hypothetical protein
MNEAVVLTDNAAKGVTTYIGYNVPVSLHRDGTMFYVKFRSEHEVVNLSVAGMYDRVISHN